MKHSKVRRAKLFYLRKRTGKRARLTERADKKPAAARAKSARAEKKTEEPVAT